MFDFGILKTYNIPKLSIGIGNLTVGGTGKSTLANYFLKKYSNSKITYVSRGFGRKTSGELIINKNHTVSETGDESLMLFNKYPYQNFILNAKRKLAYISSENLYPETAIYLFDDVFQHRYVKPNINILLCDFNRPFYTDFLMPSGTLRETKNGAKRADIIIVTKSKKDIENSHKIEIIENIRKFNSHCEIFFSNIKNDKPINNLGEILAENSSIIMLSALANNDQFYQENKKKFDIKKHYKFPDHYDYKIADLDKIFSENPGCNIVCTQKDYVKIKALVNSEFIPSYYVIDQQFEINNEAGLENILKNHNFPAFS